MAEPRYRWDEVSGRYRNLTTGRFLSEREVRAAVDAVADAASDRLAALSQRLLDGGLTLAEWQRDVMRTVKDANLAGAMAAHGGKAQMSPAANGAVGRTVREQYGFLRAFAAEIEGGAQPLTGRLVARARLYGQHARVAFEHARTRLDAARGLAEESNVLAPAEHCEGDRSCTAQTARGWVVTGSLVPIGQRRCRANCRCRIRRRRKAA